MIDMRTGLRHLGWANDRFFASLAEQPPEAFEVTYAPGMWSVGQLTTHIVGSSEWYRYCLTGAGWTDLHPATSRPDVERLRRYLAQIDEVLVAQAEFPDELMTFEDETGPSSAMRSMLLSQAVMHAAEHRAQICCALAANGFAAPSLDDLDLWSFAAWERAQG